jgi:hypothetical protein
MSVECQGCARKSDLFLCGGCQSDLRALLVDLPWWLARLTEAALGHVRLGDGGGRRGHRAGLEQYTDPKPAMDGQGGTEGQRRLERDLGDAKLRARLLAQGGVNSRASEALAAITGELSTWVRHVCEQRGLDVPALDAPGSARWLAMCVGAIACDEAGGECLASLKADQRHIEAVVNRPVEPRTCGPCPTAGEHTDRGFVMRDVRTRCGTRLEAPAAAVEVRCPTCRQTYHVESLITRLINETHYMRFTIRELLDVVLPRAEIPVPRATLYLWVKRGKLVARGTRADGSAEFLFADVRKCRMESTRMKSA